MMTKKTIKKLRLVAAKKAFRAKKMSRTLYKNKKGSDGRGESREATYLYIRAFDGDNGSRPVPDETVFWMSPDIQIYDPNGVQILTSELKANVEHTIKVIVQNDGDHDCNSCTVDLFFDDPSVGFSVTASEALGILLGPVSNHSTAGFEFRFTPTGEMIGHKCIFARAYSIINNDYPADLINLYAAADRHIGQRNLNIMAQGEKINIKVNRSRAKIKRLLKIAIKQEKQIAAEAHLPGLSKYFISQNKIKEDGISVNRLKIDEPPAAVDPSRTGSPVRTGTTSSTRILNINKPGIQAKLEVIKRSGKLEWKYSSNDEQDFIQVAIPNLGLKANEMVPLTIRAYDAASGETVGGITIIVHG